MSRVLSVPQDLGRKAIPLSVFYGMGLAGLAYESTLVHERL
jgi:hypothetical protein